MARACFVLNPVSGGGKAARRWSRALSVLGPRETRETDGPGEAARIARQALCEGFDRIVAVGGDGTVREVASALLGTEAVLGVVPAGTANDLARTLGLPTDIALAARAAESGAPRVVDAAATAGGGTFCNVAGAGFDAAVSAAIAGQRAAKRLGPQARYYLAILTTFARYRATHLAVTVDAVRHDAPGCLLAAVGVMRYYGNGLMILPDADPADGLLDVCWGQDVRLRELLGFLRLLRDGRHLGHPKVRYAQGREVTLESSEPTPFHLDGDLAGELPVSVRILPGALRVAVPSN